MTAVFTGIEEKWKFKGHRGSINTLAVDSKNSVCSGSADSTTRKISSEGVEIWQVNGHQGDVLSIVVNSDDNIYTCGLDKTVRKLNSSGKELWKFTQHTNALYAITIDDQGNIYSGGYDNTVRKINASNAREIWLHEEINAIKITGLQKENKTQEETIASISYELMMLQTASIMVASVGEHSPKFNMIRIWYNKGFWTADMVRDAVEHKWLTQEEANEIIV